jgi:hypothetical protein
VTDPRAFWGCLGVLVLAACLAAAPKDAPPGPVIRLAEGKGAATVDVTGLSKEALAGLARLAPADGKWGKVLALYVDRPGKGRDGQPAVLGTHRLDRGVLRFEPRFPLVRGVRYRVVLDQTELPGGAGSKPVEVVLSLPRAARKPTAVVAQVYPSGDRLPENLLRFYLHFSAPMSQGNSLQHIKLLDGKGKLIDLPFLKLNQELWDPSGTRFTLFLDPGRIKRGLKPREDMGPVLEGGKRYTLVIERTWKDAEGDPLKDTFRKSFRVGASDDRQPDEKTWRLTAPAAGSRAPLGVTFPRAMDHATALRMIWVVDAAGKKVPGKATLADRETTWSFTPDVPWRVGAYDLVADTRVEDLCGNSIGQPFEIDVLRRGDRQVKTETVKVPFRVRSGR